MAAGNRDVTRGIGPPVRNRLGAKAANPTTLTGQDLRGPRAPFAPWNHATAARAVTFRLSLQPGEARLEAAIAGQRKDGKAVAPYFLDVNRLGGA
jgi:hypothetical protein